MELGSAGFLNALATDHALTVQSHVTTKDTEPKD